MAEKKKVLCWFDSPTVSTGFGTVAKNVLKELYKTGKYEFDIIGINHAGDPYDQNEFPYRIFPAVAPLAADESLRSDVYGMRKFLMFAGSGMYDLIFIMNDLFIINPVMDNLMSIQASLPKEKKFEIIVYFPIDSPPKASWIKSVVKRTAFPVTYTKYGYNECLKHDASLENKLRYIYHGVDKSVFFPLSEDLIRQYKKEIYEKHADKFIVLNVNRNQPRKDLHRTFAGFSVFHQKYPDSLLYILAQANDVGGNLLEIAYQYGLEWGKDWLCPPPNTYNAANGYPVHVVNILYNTADVVVSSTLGEGFGLSIVEAFATKTPVLFPDNTSLHEIIGENEERGYFIKSGADLNFRICLGVNDNDNVRPTIDIYDMANKLEYIYLHQDEAQAKANRAYEEVWTWETVCKQWEAIFDKALYKVSIRRANEHYERNAPCPCGSGIKYKDCCGK